MHEYSIVAALIEQCESHAKSSNAEKITKVVTKIGVLSGVEPQLLQQAFETFKTGTVCNDADLVIELQRLLIECRNCGAKSLKDELTLLCPHCDSLDTEVIDGEDMYLMRLEME